MNRRTNSSDRRVLVVSLSVKGSEVIDMYYNKRNDYMQENLGVFSDQEMEDLKTLLDKYIQSSVLKSKDIELVCMVCNGTYGSNCGLNAANDNQCEYLIKKGVA